MSENSKLSHRIASVGSSDLMLCLADDFTETFGVREGDQVIWSLAAGPEATLKIGEQVFVVSAKQRRGV